MHVISNKIIDEIKWYPEWVHCLSFGMSFFFSTLELNGMKSVAKQEVWGLPHLPCEGPWFYQGILACEP